MRRPHFNFCVLMLMLATVTGCSNKKEEGQSSRDRQAVVEPSFGAVTGTVQVAQGSGDVKALAFKTVKLSTEGYAVLSDAERNDIGYDVDLGLRGQAVDLISSDELQRKTQAKVSAMESFQKRLPEKVAIRGIAITTTDAGGNFTFDRVQPGTYWVNLDSDLAGNYLGWSVRVEVLAGAPTTVQLNNTDLDYGFR
jgi:hypothetical protein